MRSFVKFEQFQISTDLHYAFFMSIRPFVETGGVNSIHLHVFTQGVRNVLTTSTVIFQLAIFSSKSMTFKRILGNVVGRHGNWQYCNSY